MRSSSKRNAARLAASLVLLLIRPASVRAGETPQPVTDASIRRLSAAVERLGALLEKEAVARADERESRRIETVISILGLRTRKIERLESEIESLGREEEEARDAVRRVRERIETIEKEGRTETGEIPADVKREVGEMETGARYAEVRATRAAERRSLLEGDLAAELRRVADLEHLVGTWVENLR